MKWKVTEVLVWAVGSIFIATLCVLHPNWWDGAILLLYLMNLLSAFRKYREAHSKDRLAKLEFLDSTEQTVLESDVPQAVKDKALAILAEERSRL